MCHIYLQMGLQIHVAYEFSIKLPSTPMNLPLCSPNKEALGHPGTTRHPPPTGKEIAWCFKHVQEIGLMAMENHRKMVV